MVEPHSSNFKVIATNSLGGRIFRKFTVCKYANYLRMNKETFDMLLKKIKPHAFVYNVADTNES